MEKLLAKTDEIIWRRIGDEIVVIKDNGQSIHMLNKTAAFIWEHCDGTGGVESIAAKVCERFDVVFKQANADVKETVGKFVKIGIVDLGG